VSPVPPPTTGPRHRGERPLSRTRALALLIVLSACAAQQPARVVGDGATLAPCPSSPNCVSSTARDEHFIEPFRLATEPAAAWRALHEVVAELPRTRIVRFDARWLHAECRSRIFGFVDDLELELRPDDNLIAVRSASRVGYSDLGVNRDRVERIRAELRARGVVK